MMMNMYNLKVTFAALLSLSALLNVHGGEPSRLRREFNSVKSFRRQDDQFRLVDYTEGEGFYGWDYFVADDPTHGTVQYVPLDEAKNSKLVSVAPGDGGSSVFSLRVDNKATLGAGEKRKSVRITSPKKFNDGLFVADFAKMPFGCGVWPAWWTVGPNWPEGGEIDVVEGVNSARSNQYTLHTSSGCQLSQKNNAQQPMNGKVIDPTCAVGGGDNSGCAVKDEGNQKSFGPGFNEGNGGVFAHKVDSKGIRIWFFPRDRIPEDINGELKDKHPNPDAWPRPDAFFSADECDIQKHFYEHVMVLNIAICGDWAGSVYGQDGECTSKYLTCEEAVRHPENFDNAEWKVNRIAVFQNHD